MLTPIDIKEIPNKERKGGKPKSRYRTEIEEFLSSDALACECEFDSSIHKNIKQCIKFIGIS